MPLYEYHCEDCGKEFELLVRGNQTPSCPHCEGDHLAKRLSVPAAPITSAGALPTADWGGCGKPGCGPGGCGMGGLD